MYAFSLNSIVFPVTFQKLAHPADLPNCLIQGRSASLALAKDSYGQRKEYISIKNNGVGRLITLKNAGINLTFEQFIELDHAHQLDEISL